MSPERRCTSPEARPRCWKVGDSTVDIDVRFEPDSGVALSRIRDLKEELSINVELASPLDFLPALAGWQDRSRFRFREGNLEVFDFDPYSQALSKLERGFELDLDDVTTWCGPVR